MEFVFKRVSLATKGLVKVAQRVSRRRESWSEVKSC